MRTRASASSPDDRTANRRPPLSRVLSKLAGDESRERITVGDLMTTLRGRARAAMLLVFALPNVLPAPPGLSFVLGAPLLFLAAQLAFGRPTWLPHVITERSISRSHFARLMRRIRPWLVRAERLPRRRLDMLTRPPLEYLIWLVCLVLALILFLPIPLGNMLPALAICVLALGVLERDGVWVLAGLFTAVVSVALVWGVLYALIQGALYVLSHGLP